MKIYTNKLYILKYIMKGYNQVLYTVCTGCFAKPNKNIVHREFIPNGKGKFHLMGGMVKNRKQTRNERTALKWIKENKQSEMELENPDVYYLPSYSQLTDY